MAKKFAKRCKCWPFGDIIIVVKGIFFNHYLIKIIKIGGRILLLW